MADDQSDDIAREQPSADGADIAHIRAYLEQQREIYHRDALRTKLLEDGYAPESIERAMAQVYGGAQAPPVAQAARMTGAMLVASLATVLLNGGICLAGYRFIPGSGMVATVLGALVSILAMAFFTHRQPAVARGIRWGCAIWVLFVAGLTVVVLATFDQWG